MVSAPSVVVCPNSSPCVLFQPVASYVRKECQGIRGERLRTEMVGSVMSVCAERGVKMGWEATTGEEWAQNEQLEKFLSKVVGLSAHSCIYLLRRRQGGFVRSGRRSWVLLGAWPGMTCHSLVQSEV